MPRPRKDGTPAQTRATVENTGGFGPAAMTMLHEANAARKVKSPGEVQEIASAVLALSGRKDPAGEIGAMAEAIHYGSRAALEGVVAAASRAAEVLGAMNAGGAVPVVHGGSVPQGQDVANSEEGSANRQAENAAPVSDAAPDTAPAPVRVAKAAPKAPPAAS